MVKAFTRELALGGVFGAAALLLPMVFHLLALGRVFLPMYIPLVALAFLVRPGMAVLTAILAPVLSSLLTGMPPLYPPVVVLMAVELAFICGLIAAAAPRLPFRWIVPALALVLLLGRVVHAALAYALAAALGLPAGFVAGLTIWTAWPGMLLIVAVVPVFVRATRLRAAPLRAA